MDLATLIGLAGAIILVGTAVALGASPVIFFNPLSLLIVFGGTLCVVMAKFSLAQLKQALRATSRAFKFQLPDTTASIDELVALAKTARQKGLLALEGEQASSPFLQQGLQMLADGFDDQTLRELLQKERLLTLERNQFGANLFSAMAEVAPAMGMIGTLVGLVQMLANMSDPSSIGPAMAVALLTTLYGAMLATMVANPIAAKLSLRTSQEARMQALWIDALIAIKRETNPRVIEQMLSLYLPPEQRGREEGGELSAEATDHG
ncbi:MotA/TolQ/ExbB proton channel family protein [Halomonas sp. THAF12]|uniref:MotA/TolQ/ExbB proton channel family protein n=1 Tax=Halomonas sp. B23F22_10 TaxID=3459515 RepID=UPI00373F912F